MDLAVVMFDSAQTECVVPLWSPNATKLPMSADTGQRCFVYQTLLAAKARLCVVTVERPNKRMFGTCTPWTREHVCALKQREVV